MKKIGWLLLLAATAGWAQTSLDDRYGECGYAIGDDSDDAQFSDSTGADAHVRGCLLRWFH